ncbi:rod shape-determining protein MreD [Synechococcus sp. H60.4]|uniref:rod shape-determining protein MreD n=1 Tax=unclassified Synechococcus TaxID=2626047 RepID=UPI0039C290D1
MLNLLLLNLKSRLNWLVTALSGLLAVVAPWWRGPGLELAGLTPDWPLIWVVCWSVRRKAWQGAVAGITLGFLQDALTNPYPTHALGLAVVGILTAKLQKQRYMQEDFISVALIVFGMVVIAETLMALQWMWLTASQGSAGLEPAEMVNWLDGLANSSPAAGAIGGNGPRSLESIWWNHQRNALTSAILSSLWAPALYWPLSRWWQSQEES